jgi:hypothetical protein
MWYADGIDADGNDADRNMTTPTMPTALLVLESRQDAS